MNKLYSQIKQTRVYPLMSTAELSHYLGVPRASLYAWRAKGEGPSWYRIGGRIRYRREDVEAWIQEQKERELERRGSS